MFNLEKKPKTDFVISHENGNTVVLDINLDAQLIKEGLYREFVRALQVLRKEADFDIDQRIVASFKAEGELKDLIDEFSDKIKQEVLISRVLDNIENADIVKDVEVGEGKILVKFQGGVR